MPALAAEAGDRDGRVPHHQRRVGGGILEGMAGLVGGDAHGGQGPALIDGRAQAQHLVAGIVMVGQLAGDRLDGDVLKPGRIEHVPGGGRPAQRRRHLLRRGIGRMDAPLRPKSQQHGRRHVHQVHRIKEHAYLSWRNRSRGQSRFSQRSPRRDCPLGRRGQAPSRPTMAEKSQSPACEADSPNFTRPVLESFASGGVSGLRPPAESILKHCRKRSCRTGGDCSQGKCRASRIQKDRRWVAIAVAGRDNSCHEFHVATKMGKAVPFSRGDPAGPDAGWLRLARAAHRSLLPAGRRRAPAALRRRPSGRPISIRPSNIRTEPVKVPEQIRGSITTD